ncbi:hypothetical protein CLOM_g7868, partial [Closterium sp. NIES-68]
LSSSDRLSSPSLSSSDSDSSDGEEERKGGGAAGKGPGSIPVSSSTDVLIAKVAGALVASLGATAAGIAARATATLPVGPHATAGATGGSKASAGGYVSGGEISPKSGAYRCRLKWTRNNYFPKHRPRYRRGYPRQHCLVALPQVGEWGAERGRVRGERGQLRGEGREEECEQQQQREQHWRALPRASPRMGGVPLARQARHAGGAQGEMRWERVRGGEHRAGADVTACGAKTQRRALNNSSSSSSSSRGEWVNRAEPRSLLGLSAQFRVPPPPCRGASGEGSGKARSGRGVLDAEAAAARLQAIAAAAAKADSGSDRGRSEAPESPRFGASRFPAGPGSVVSVHSSYSAFTVPNSAMSFNGGLDRTFGSSSGLLKVERRGSSASVTGDAGYHNYSNSYTTGGEEHPQLLRLRLPHQGSCRVRSLVPLSIPPTPPFTTRQLPCTTVPVRIIQCTVQCTLQYITVQCNRIRCNFRLPPIDAHPAPDM